MPTKKAKELQRAKTARVSQKKKEHTLVRSPRKKGSKAPDDQVEDKTVTIENEIDPWERARKILHVSSTPSWLPCREEEFAELEGALTESIEESSGCCLYISGVPGTGKTATVHSVINSLQEKVASGELNPFKFFEINGMKVTEPSQTFILFWEFILQHLLPNSDSTPPKRTSAREALKNLENYFNSPCPDRETWWVHTTFTFNWQLE
jgi:origin recognition complex subunit 1